MSLNCIINFVCCFQVYAVMIFVMSIVGFRPSLLFIGVTSYEE